jgi:AraC-like DNA-binding protein
MIGEKKYFYIMESQDTQFGLSLIAYATQRDISPDELCKNANVDLQAIRRKGQYEITKKQLYSLWLYASRLGNDPLFGLHFGEALQLSALGVVGEIIKSSNTVGEAVTVAASMTHAVTDLFKMEVVHTKKAFVIELIPAVDDEGDFIMRQMSDFLMVFVIHELDGLLLRKIKPSTVYLPYSIADLKEYERVCRCTPSKRKGQWAIYFDRKFWEEPILSANYELQRFLLQQVDGSAKGKKASEITDNISQYLLTNAYLGIPSLEDVASNFNVSARSLQRRLQDEGTTFQQVADGVRKSLALRYMELGKHPIKEISIMLGYNELSAFSRAFKRWTGKAPTNYDA